MRTSPTHTTRKRAWLLQGTQMITGEVFSSDSQLDLITMETDGGDMVAAHRDCFAFDVDGARALNMRALSQLHRNLTELDREGALFVPRTISGERYGSIDI